MEPNAAMLVDMIQAIDGIETAGHTFNAPFSHMIRNWKGAMIFFSCQSQKSLFFIARCKDARYWDHGHKWRLEITAGDSATEGMPLTYCLHRPLHEDETHELEETAEQAISEECRSLCQSMADHAQHQGFMQGYGIDPSGLRHERFLYGAEAWERKSRLEQILPPPNQSRGEI